MLFWLSLVGISVMTPSYPNAVELCEVIKNKKWEHDKNRHGGGHHVSAIKQEFLIISPPHRFFWFWVKVKSRYWNC